MNPDKSKSIVIKTYPLLSLSSSSLTLSELKILDVYLSKIDTSDRSSRFVQFSKGELERLLGVQKINIQMLHRWVENLVSCHVTITDPKKPQGFITLTLIESVRWGQDENGLSSVELSCSPSAMEYIFTPEAIGYMKYALQDVCSLKSRFSYVLYLYIRKNSFQKTWTVSIDKLKAILQSTAPMYDDFKIFNYRVLRPAIVEINEKTSCKFSLNILPEKSRKKKDIQFTVTDSGIPVLDNDSVFLFEQYGTDEVIAKIKAAAPRLGNMTYLRLEKLIMEVPVNILPVLKEDNTELNRRLAYLSEKYKSIPTADRDGNKIRYKGAYLETMIKEDNARVKETISPGRDKTYFIPTRKGHEFIPTEF